MAIDPNNLAVTAKLTFAEEFNGLSLWNGSNGRWSTSYNFNGWEAHTLSGNQELQWYVDANNANTANVDPWTVSNGVLTIAAAPASASIKPYIDNYNYTSGLLTSQHSFSQQYGYFEMKAQLPDGQGLWPAFWLMPTDGDWRPELDVMEVLGSDTNTLWQFSHPADTSYDRYFKTSVPDLSAGFHTYGVDWQSDQITFYFDGHVTGIAPTPPEMNGPMYMLLNLAVGGSWGGPPDSTTHWPAQMKVDYIRAYEANTGSDTTSGGGDTSGGGSGGSGANNNTGTSGDDVFALSPLRAATIFQYDVAGHDSLSVPTGSTGFQLAAYTGQSSFKMLDVSAWWNNISGAQVLRWMGDVNAMDSVSEVDGVLQSMPGNGGGGVLVAAYTADHKVGIYYDSDPAHQGRASLVATIDNLTDVHALTASDFRPAGSSGGDTTGGDTTGGSGGDTTGGTGGDTTGGTGGDTTGGTGGDSTGGTGGDTTGGTGGDTTGGGSGGSGTVQTGSATLSGTAGDDVFMLSHSQATLVTNYDAAGHDALGVPTGADGFQIRGLAAGQTSLNVVDVSAWWNNISSAQVIRWQGDPNTMDSAAEVDGVLQSMPGNQGGGALVVAYTADHSLGLYYDSDPSAAGGVSLVATLSGLHDPDVLAASDFRLFS